MRSTQRDKLDMSHCSGLPATVATSVREKMRREDAAGVRTSEKQDRATVEQALDPRTRLARTPDTRYEVPRGGPP